MTEKEFLANFGTLPAKGWKAEIQGGIIALTTPDGSGKQLCAIEAVNLDLTGRFLPFNSAAPKLGLSSDLTRRIIAANDGNGCFKTREKLLASLGLGEKHKQAA